MGTILYDFLVDSLLFDESLVADEFAGINEDRIWQELHSYREFSLTNLHRLEDEAWSMDTNLRVFSSLSKTELSLLKQSALYVDQFILADPLFELTYEAGPTQKAVKKYLRVGEESLNRSRLKSIIAYLKSLTPLVAADFVKFLPSSLLTEPPEEVPIHYSETLFTDVLPQEIMEYFRQQLIVETLEKRGNSYIVAPANFPSRSIAIRFDDHVEGELFLYQLFQQEITSISDTGFTSIMTLPDTSPDEGTFRIWLEQSKNRAAIEFYNRIGLDVYTSAHFGCAYLTKSPFVFNLLGIALPEKSDLHIDTMNFLLQMDVPVLEQIDLTTLMQIRAEDGDAFDNFRAYLNQQLRELRLERDPERLSKMIENIGNEIFEVQLAAVNQKVASLRKKALAEAAVITGGLIGAIQTSGWSLLTSALALAQGYNTYLDYVENVKQNPAYFLWRVTRS